MDSLLGGIVFSYLEVIKIAQGIIFGFLVEAEQMHQSKNRIAQEALWPH